MGCQSLSNLILQLRSLKHDHNFTLNFFVLMCVSLNALYFSQMAKKFTEDSFANHIRSLISNGKTHDAQYYNMTPYLDSVGTTHVSVLADDGSAVSVTSTINHMSVFCSTVTNQPPNVIVGFRVED